MLKNKIVRCYNCKAQLEERLLGVEAYYYCSNCFSITSAREMAKQKESRIWLNLCA